MREIILINITGKDKPGLTASLTNILAQYEVTILDIGQAVIHDYLSLGILVEIPSAHRSSSILKDLLFQAHELGIQIRFDYFGQFLQKRLNLDYVFANGLEIESGKVTGNVSGDIIDGLRKAEILKTIATVENINLQQTIAIGDGANDLPMLSIAGLGIAFHAKPIVKKNAQKSISSVGLDGLLYLMGISEREIRQP
ncbi:MAG: ACT domain-containing protein [Desulfobacterales bacterium]|jgi:predicted amino acid-binding ACT domain protein